MHQQCYACHATVADAIGHAEVCHARPRPWTVTVYGACGRDVFYFATYRGAETYVGTLPDTYAWSIARS